ncbi:unnamed protein product [Acanthoscelides obtectus]|uniref:Uncharacterized protein n=1 Tax=Acanthoscelides obtectus TaxID=200917 RepID=A0A9P0MAT4_ACAOB|nr:unnamed protein product [Acanthoscelides obtectus]CAK1632187.1 hypothetical protein AOBTE_LOCUS7391 [Acanthoscelides obtectus]
MELVGENIFPVKQSPQGKGRKKLLQPETHKRNVDKLARYIPKALPTIPTCGHNGRPGLAYYCTTLTMKQIKDFHAYLYQSKDKIKQDLLILACCKGQSPKTGKSNHAAPAIKYHVRLSEGELIRVCAKSFLGITNLSKDRIQRIVRNFVVTGELPRKRRGGNRVGPKNDETRNCIKRFIESITCTESHYCRSKTSVRVYLPCDLNFKKLFDHYLRRVPQPMHVKLSYFRKYVNANYNIAFGTPLTDCCSTCLRTKEQLKVATSLDVRQKLVTEHRVHIAKAKAFFKLLKNQKPNTTYFSFDCQKNLALPRLPDQAAYFSQQINYNNFTVVAGTSTDKLRPKNVFSYLWTEIDARKDSNTIASALQYALKNFDFHPSKETVRLFADGCGGQNKNTNMMAMLAYWLLEESPKHIKQIELIFPIVVKGEPNYCSDVGQAKSVCKKKFSLPSMAPEKLPLGKGIKGDKSTINVLLSNHYGANWRSLPELNFYKEHLKTASASPEETVDSLENCQNAENDCFFV